MRTRKKLLVHSGAIGSVTSLIRLQRGSALYPAALCRIRFDSTEVEEDRVVITNTEIPKLTATLPKVLVGMLFRSGPAAGTLYFRHPFKYARIDRNLGVYWLTDLVGGARRTKRVKAGSFLVFCEHFGGTASYLLLSPSEFEAMFEPCDPQAEMESLHLIQCLDAGPTMQLLMP